MKIALFVNSFPKLSETFILNQIDGLLKCGHEITIFPRQPSGEKILHPIAEEQRLLEKTRFPAARTEAFTDKIALRLRLAALSLGHREPISRLKNRFREYGYIGRWRRALIEAEPLIRHGGRFDILFAHFGPNGLRAAWYRAAGLVTGSLVTVFHGYDMTEYLRSHSDGIYAPLWRNGDLFLPISRFWQDRLEGLGCPAAKIRVHHVGIDCEHFSYSTRSLDPGEPAVLISVARLVEKKGIEYAIRAVGRVIASGANIRYRIIGDGPLSAALKQMVSEMRLDAHIEFLGVKTSDEVADELSRAHVLLAPSVTSSRGDMEGIPTVLMEAMAMGMPVISTWHSGIPELVQDGVSGKLVKERDEAALANAIGELIADAGHWAAMGAAGREKVLQEFDMRTLNTQLAHQFGALMRRRGQSGRRDPSANTGRP